MADTQEFLEDGVMSLVLQFTDKLPLKATEIGYEVIAEQQQMLVEAILQHFQQEQEKVKSKEGCPACNTSGSEHTCEGLCMFAPREKLIPQLEVDRLIREAIDDYIKPHLTYCREQNGMPYCKNCGLSEQKSVDN